MLSLLTTVVNDTGSNVIAGVVDTGDKLTAGVVNAIDKFTAGVTEINVNLRKDSGGKLPLTTLLVNLPPVSLRLAIFSKKLEMKLFGSLGAWGKMIHEKNQR
jgi:hypothetical protein